MTSPTVPLDEKGLNLFSGLFYFLCLIKRGSGKRAEYARLVADYHQKSWIVAKWPPAQKSEKRGPSRWMRSVMSRRWGGGGAAVDSHPHNKK